MDSRWEQLLAQKPVPLVEALLEEVSKLLARDLTRWPLPVESVDPQTANPFQELLAPDARRPGAAVFHEAFRLAGWELTRELLASDEYMRHERYLEHGVAPHERTALLFVSRWLMEQLLALGEATSGRVKRADLVRCLEKTAARTRV